MKTSGKFWHLFLSLTPVFLMKAQILINLCLKKIWLKALLDNVTTLMAIIRVLQQMLMLHAPLGLASRAQKSLLTIGGNLNCMQRKKKFRILIIKARPQTLLFILALLMNTYNRINFYWKIQLLLVLLGNAVM